MKDVFFNNKKLPRPKKEYVAFLDIMGTKNHMIRSVMETSNFIFKLHAAVLSVWRKSAYQGVFVYPIMDGVYITATRKEDMEKLLIRIFSTLAEGFINETNPVHQFIPRCGLAYGEIIHGHTVPYEASKVFELDLSYKNNILLGKAMIEAYGSEGEASPFGICVHESAIKSGKKGKNGVFPAGWRWHNSTEIKIPEGINIRLGKALEAYYATVKNEQHILHYPLERIAEHERKAAEYFNLEEAIV